LAKHRAIPPVSFGLVLALAVVGAVASAVLVSAFGTGERRPAAQSQPQAGVPVTVTLSPSISAAAPVVEPTPSPASASVSPTVGPPSLPPSPIRPARSRTPSTPPPSTTPPPAVTLTARYVVTSDWDGGFVVGVEVRNTGNRPVSWVVEVTYAPSVIIFMNGNNPWNATVERAGSVYRFRANSGVALSAGQKAQFGYIASGPSGTSRAVRCTVNGHTCE
jgi:cellulase/cellobiase CelA1